VLKKNTVCDKRLVERGKILKNEIENINMFENTKSIYEDDADNFKNQNDVKTSDEEVETEKDDIVTEIQEEKKKLKNVKGK